jgi:hypothetical protein
MSGHTDAPATAALEVNGPEDDFDWNSVSWGQAEKDVRRLRQRIFAASQAGDLAKVWNLQKLILRSRSNALVSVRRVTEVNAGRKTAGVDGKVALLAQDKADLADWVQHGAAKVPGGRGHVASSSPTAWPMPAMPGTAAARRPRAAKPTRMGTMAHDHAQSDPQTRDHLCRGPR